MKRSEAIMDEDENTKYFWISTDVCNHRAIKKQYYYYDRDLLLIPCTKILSFHNSMFSCFLRNNAATRRLPALVGSTVAKNWMPMIRPMATTPRPFTILGVQQIALGSTDKAGMDKLWGDIFGFQAESTHRLEKENVIEDILRVGAAKSPFAVEVDLMQPIDPEKSPKVRFGDKYPY